MCLLLRRFRVSYLFSFVTAVIYGFVLDAFMLLGAALPAGSVWLRAIYYVLGMLFCLRTLALRGREVGDDPVRADQRLCHRAILRVL